ncbi:SubName: Full=Uncharacterized protein {ECO:0000313/EMBL:CCA68356.1} [Serendipita indica DSM 11827]|uniref:Uncharacterized protein n=1 Tax=Serendipita indica (strain DSM 11827) TaxID=1109443 RepID=G4TAL3_SERID|nr:SubName: Full=Uncharacterized protein {ECO:0000313/EMBL:CCA68356.1} [Serendipita indica DSM 11827]CCA68356.1 hypothetical protein PIIN_02222 [Serendipita indica DSM 11827]
MSGTIATSTPTAGSTTGPFKTHPTTTKASAADQGSTPASSPSSPESASAAQNNTPDFVKPTWSVTEEFAPFIVASSLADPSLSF